MKLNYKNTLFVGLAFFVILMLWQVYNTYCPLMLKPLLKDALNLEDENKVLYIVGIIMAVDNIFALFLLPIFGNLSDMTNTRFGKRMPFIALGMISSAIVFPFIAIFFMMNSLIGVILSMLFLLTITHMYRSPAVSLMPDITPKPLRSKANGIINLVGYIGAIIAGALAMVFKREDQYIFPFIIASGCMILALIILLVKIKENKLVAEAEKEILKGEEESETLEEISEDGRLSKGDRRNFIIIIIAVFLWFMAFNAVETFMSTYFVDLMLGQGKDAASGVSAAGTAVIILTVSSIITFIPSSFLASLIGRKLSVAIGLSILIAGFIIAIFQIKFGIIFIIAIALCGIGWAMINVNSYPMIVEMSNQKNIGKITGYYYVASMLAQSVTPIILGIIMTLNGKTKPLFYYASIVASLAFIVFIFFKERNVRQIKKKGIEVFDVD